MLDIYSTEIITTRIIIKSIHNHKCQVIKEIKYAMVLIANVYSCYSKYKLSKRLNILYIVFMANDY